MPVDLLNCWTVELPRLKGRKIIWDACLSANHFHSINFMSQSMSGLAAFLSWHVSLGVKSNLNTISEWNPVVLADLLY